MNLLTSQLIKEARKWIGVKEVAPNSGPEIDAWLARVFRRPGNPWCAAFAWAMIDDACKACLLENRMPATAGVHLMIARAKQLNAWTREPGPGYVYAIDHGRSATGSRIGHCGIVVEVADDHIMEISGNTNEAGSREGNAVALKSRPLSAITMGYFDPGRMFA